MARVDLEDEAAALSIRPAALSMRSNWRSGPLSDATRQTALSGQPIGRFGHRQPRRPESPSSTRAERWCLTRFSGRKRRAIEQRMGEIGRSLRHRQTVCLPKSGAADARSVDRIRQRQHLDAARRKPSSCGEFAIQEA